MLANSDLFTAEGAETTEKKLKLKAIFSSHHAIGTRHCERHFAMRSNIIYGWQAASKVLATLQPLSGQNG